MKHHTRNARHHLAKRTYLVLLSAGALTLFAGALLQMHPSSSHNAITLSPEPVGLAQGVAACGSSAIGPSCNSNGTANETISWDFSGGNCVGVAIRGQVQAGAENSNTFSGALPCTSQTTIQNLSSNTTYSYYFDIDVSYTYCDYLTTENGGCYQTTGYEWVSGLGGTAVAPGGSYSNTTGSFSTPNCSGYVATAPSPPGGMTATCNANDTAATLAWTASPGATTYYPRFWIPSGTCPSGWTMYSDGHTCYINGYGGTSITVPTTQGLTYGAWVSAGDPVATDSNGNWLAAVTGSFTCTPPPPPDLMTATCNANDTAATLAWTASPGATTYYPRFSIPSGTCPSGWTMYSDGHTCYIDRYNGTSITVPTTQGLTYNAWVHAGDPIATDSNGNWLATVTGSFTCTLPLGPAGSLSNVTSPCYIASGQTTCQPYFDWTTSNTNGIVATNMVGSAPYTSEQTYVSPMAVSGTHGSGAALPAGSFTLKLYGQNSSNAWVLLDSKAIVVTPLPTGSLTTSDCTVSAGQTTCQVPTSWTSQYTSYNGQPMTQVNMYNASGGLYGGGSGSFGVNYYQVAANNGSYSFTLPPGSYLAALYGFGATQWYLLDQKTVTVTAPPSGTISASPNPCTFASANVTTCTTGLNWTTTNAPNACVFYSADQNGNPGMWCLASTTATYWPNWINQAGITFTLRVGNTGSSQALASVVAKGVPCSCDPTQYTCSNSGACRPLVPGFSLTANPILVRSGATSNLTITAADVTSCQVSTAPNSSAPQTTTFTGDSNNSINTQVTSGQIYGQTTFTLTCKDLSGNLSPSQSTAVVSIAPLFNEQ